MFTKLNSKVLPHHFSNHANAHHLTKQPHILTLNTIKMHYIYNSSIKTRKPHHEGTSENIYHFIIYVCMYIAEATLPNPQPHNLQ